MNRSERKVLFQDQIFDFTSQPPKKKTKKKQQQKTLSHFLGNHIAFGKECLPGVKKKKKKT